MLNKPHLAVINFDTLTGKHLHDFIRGMDKVPGATLTLNGEQVKVFGSKRWGSRVPTKGAEVQVAGMKRPGLICDHGLFLFGVDNEPGENRMQLFKHSRCQSVCVQKIQLSSGKMINASMYGKEDERASITFTEQEHELVRRIELIWSSILRCEVDNSTDFFKCGAGSMDVTRLVEEIKDQFEVAAENEDVYMASVFEDFCKTLVLKLRGSSSATKLDFTPTIVNIDKKRSVSFPTQLFINNKFVNASQKATTTVVNPSDESVICQVQCATRDDVDRAVQAAHAAFNGEWSKMNARDRGALMYKLAELMDKHREELAMIESIDSGAVYTLACKTHIG